MPKTALVTGANQGLGYALVEHLAGRLAEGDRVYLAARSKQRGRAALSPGEAAVPIADLLLLPEGAASPNGQLVQHGKSSPGCEARPAAAQARCPPA